MRKQQSGFTMIELIMVIVILGILAAIAILRFVSLQGEAGDASAQSVTGALSSAAAINYAQRLASAGARGIAITSGTTTCNDLLPLMTNNQLSSDANVTFVNSAAVITCANPAGAGGTASACNVLHSQGRTPAGFAATIVCTN